MKTVPLLFILELLSTYTLRAIEGPSSPRIHYNTLVLTPSRTRLSHRVAQPHKHFLSIQNSEGGAPEVFSPSLQEPRSAEPSDKQRIKEQVRLLATLRKHLEALTNPSSTSLPSS